MCKYNQLWGSILVAFSLGLLLGTWIDSGFWNHVLALGLIFGGLCVIKKR